jgi:PAS domain S-box-containing protein
MSGSENFFPNKETGDLLRSSEDHYRAVAEAATEAIITINSQSTILLVNPAAEKIFGYLTEEMLGRQLTMLMPKYQRHSHRAGIARYLETGHRHLEWGAVQLPGLHKNGQEIALEISFLEFSKDGQRFFTGIVRKVPERNRPLADSRSNHELLSAIINQTTVGISVVDMQGHFTFANERYCQIVGRPREDLLKITMAVITHADDLQENLVMFERAIAGGGNFEIIKRYVRPDGTCVPVHDSVSVLHDAAGPPCGVMAVTLDLTKTSPEGRVL